MRKKKRRKSVSGLVPFLLVFLAVIAAAGTWIQGSGAELLVSEKEEAAGPDIRPAEDSGQDWRLILVNKAHPIPEDWEISFTELSNGNRVDSRIYPDLQQMFDDARAAGLGLFVREGYRTWEEQQQLMDDKVAAFIQEGYERPEAERLAEQWVAVPGTSEHQLGISVDINADTAVSSNDAVYGWLEANAHRYGFIKRYPEDKTDITGINNEPWHFRYVGKEAAQEIFEQGICLEEYLGLT